MLFALLGSIALTRRTWWPSILALLASLFVADTRLVLGVHWFSDVAFGLTFGIVWGVAVANAMRRNRKHGHSDEPLSRDDRA